MNNFHTYLCCLAAFHRMGTVSDTNTRGWDTNHRKITYIRKTEEKCDWRQPRKKTWKQFLYSILQVLVTYDVCREGFLFLPCNN
jgi:hypothetical protein